MWKDTSVEAPAKAPPPKRTNREKKTERGKRKKKKTIDTEKRVSKYLVVNSVICSSTVVVTVCRCFQHGSTEMFRREWKKKIWENCKIPTLSAKYSVCARRVCCIQNDLLSLSSTSHHCVAIAPIILLAIETKQKMRRLPNAKRKLAPKKAFEEKWANIRRDIATKRFPHRRIQTECRTKYATPCTSFDARSKQNSNEEAHTVESK